MKSMVLVSVLLFVALSRADPLGYPRGCIYILGRCSKECPVGTHAYALGCGYKTPEPTCLQPNPVPEEYMLCDYSACYCDAPTIRDEVTDECVLPKDCSPQKVDPVIQVDPPKLDADVAVEEPKPDVVMAAEEPKPDVKEPKPDVAKVEP